MRRTLSLALALLAATPGYAQIRVIAELRVPSSPAAAAPVGGASFALPSLMPQLMPAPTITATIPAPAIAASAALIQTGSALSAAAKEGRDQGEIFRQSFDASVKPAAGTTVVAAPTAAAPRLNAPAPRRQPLKTRAAEAVEVGTMAVPFAFVSLFVNGMLSDPAIAIPAMLALWGAGAYAMRDHLGGMRSTVVDSWQASHDQRYRVDHATGRLRDIRGRKYGEDRWERRANGPVGRVATMLISAAAALAAAGFLLLGR